jgi:elongation factor P--(R)-beta-lysine ligase
VKPQPSHHSFGPSASLAALKQRAALLRSLRKFFDGRGFVEVETPLLANEIIPELHIEPIRTTSGEFLQSSPELHMKRLVASGATAIYQVTRSFRKDERGDLHNPEFTIVEWYRVGDEMETGIGLLDDLTRSLLQTLPAARTTYADAFQRFLGIDPHAATVAELAATAKAADVCPPVGMGRGDRDEWLNLLLATRIEPQLGRNRPEILYHYPASQASLAQVVIHAGREVAERFELYYHGIELANGFHELGETAELRRRFQAVNAGRAADGRDALPLPESLFAALELGLPRCTGCALGFDRLVMLALGATSLGDVTAFTSKAK